jgi:hypothetical protein
VITLCPDFVWFLFLSPGQGNLQIGIMPETYATFFSSTAVFATRTLDDD